MARETAVKEGASRPMGAGVADRGLLLAVLVSTLAIRGLHLIGLKLGSRAQAPSGPRNPEGDPFEYFVHAPSTSSPDLGTVLGNWDGQWYRRIAEEGYPRADEVLSANDAWSSAFPPGFPALTRATMEVTGLSFGWAAHLLNTGLTLLAVGLLFQVLRSAGLKSLVAAAGAVGVSLLPSSPVLSTAYSEALALLLVILALRLLLGHRYLLMATAVLALSVTRPVAVAFAPVVVLHAGMRWQAERAAITWRDWSGMGIAAVAAAISPWLWPRAAAAIYGVPEGTAFAGSARTDQIASGLGAGYLGTALSIGGVGALVLVLLASLALVGVPAFMGIRVGWPLELSAWGAAYLAMVIIATPITPGFLRYLVLAAPLLVIPFAALVARPTPLKTALLLGLVGACLWSQWFWIRYLFILDPAPALLPWAP